MNSISGKLMLVLTLCCGLTLAAGITLNYRLARAEILQQVQQLAGVLREGEYSPAELERLIRKLVLSNTDIFGATIALAEPTQTAFAPYYFREGAELKRLDLARNGATYRRENWFSSARSGGRAVWVEPYIDLIGAGLPMTTFAVPAYRPDERGQRQLYAVVTADLPLSELRDYLQHLPLGDSAHSLLLSRGGVVLVARSEALQMRHYGELSDDPRWAPLIDRFLNDLGRFDYDGGRIDARENVKAPAGRCCCCIRATNCWRPCASSACARR